MNELFELFDALRLYQKEVFHLSVSIYPDPNLVYTHTLTSLRCIGASGVQKLGNTKKSK